MLPSVHLEGDVDDVENQVRIQLYAVKDDDVDGHLDETGWPTPYTLPNGQPHAKQTKDNGNSFDECHNLADERLSLPRAAQARTFVVVPLVPHASSLLFEGKRRATLPLQSR